MSRFITYGEILDGKIDPNFGVSFIKGSSLTIPGQGSDLMQIIESIVKLPPLDERTFDVSSGVEPDERVLALQVDLDAVYLADGVNLAKDAQERQKAAKTAKEAKEGAADDDEGGGQGE